MKRKAIILLCAVAACSIACTPLQKQREAVRDDSGEKVSVGTVQREIKVGMSGDEIITVLGSPNMVTTDAQRRETWVYDKVSTENVRSSSGGGLWLLLAGANSSSSVSSSSQRTLTIVIKFDEKGLVRDYAYRQSSF